MLEDLGDAMIARFLAAGRLRRFAQGDVLMRHGDASDCMVIVNSGRVEVSLSTAHGGKSILGVYGPGTILGDIGCLDGKERSADVTALEPLAATVIMRADVLRIIEEDAPTALTVIEALCQKVRNATAVLEMRVLSTGRARLANALLRLADQPEGASGAPVSQRWLGDYSGLTRENVNRQLGKWSRAGVARFDNGEIVILDRARLLDIVLDDQPE